jgi:hypothetical protein
VYRGLHVRRARKRALRLVQWPFSSEGYTYDVPVSARCASFNGHSLPPRAPRTRTSDPHCFVSAVSVAAQVEAAASGAGSIAQTALAKIAAKVAVAKAKVAEAKAAVAATPSSTVVTPRPTAGQAKAQPPAALAGAYSIRQG